jgi:DNA-binding LacI/PurR family transcriptional regulator
MDVAHKAGVSRALVSLVLQDSPKVSDHKRRTVQEAMAALDYRPSNAARALASGRTGTIGVVLDDLANPWFVQLLDGLQSVLAQKNLRMVLGDPRYLARPGDSAVSLFTELRVDGLVIAGDIQSDEDLDRTTTMIPTVVAGARDFDLPAADLVTNDDVAGAHAVVEHLIGLGHRDIAYLTAPTGPAALRAGAYVDAMTRQGLHAYIRVVPTTLTEQSGFEAMNWLISSGRTPTAVFAANDVVAFGALSAADDHALTVPARLSLVGYDNTNISGIRHLSLTTVDPVSHAVGIRAAELLVQRIADRSLPPRSEMLTPRLVVRRSTAPPLPS